MMIRKIYFTFYLIGARIARDQWPAEINKWKGVSVVALVQWLVIIAIAGWVQVFTQQSTIFNFSRVGIGAMVVALAAINYFFLQQRKEGPAFEKEFEKLSSKDRFIEYLKCALIVALIIALIGASVIAYRNRFG